MKPLAYVVLAAGVGKRMGGKSPKVLACARSKSLIEHVLTTLAGAPAERTVVVTGFGKELVEQVVQSGAGNNSYSSAGLCFAVQEQQLGTGHAVKAALLQLNDFTGMVCIVYGDMPLLSKETLGQLLETHTKTGAALTITTYKGPTHNAYGKVVRSATGVIQKVVEVKDCTPPELIIDEVNVGFYAVETAALLPALQNLQNNNAQREYYLTDIVEGIAAQGLKTSSITIADPVEMQGVNTHWDLALINKLLLQRRIEALINSGVVIQDPGTLYLDETVSVEPGAFLGAQLTLLGRTAIGRNAILEGSAYLKDVTVMPEATIKFCVRAEGAVIGPRAAVGPFAHLRPESLLDADVRVGNFVETKKTHLARGAKASHLTYLGDADVGEDVNIGAGTITCNYDGYKKSKTIIEANAFIGSDTCLVAPVRIGKGATIGAGSVITQDVEAEALALTRAEAKVKSGWSKDKREKSGKMKHSGIL